MPQEIELKLILAPEKFTMLAELLSQLGAQPCGQVSLQNIYFDTTEGHLHQAKAALRLRFNGTEWLQTLKTSGTDLGGLSARNEWEMPVPSQQLNLQLFPPEALPAQFNSQLEEQFSTNFTRQIWLYVDTSTQPPSHIEIAADLGQVTSPKSKNSLPIHEVELELQQGEPLALIELAAKLAQHLAFNLSRISKAERGMLLLSQQPVPLLKQATLETTQASIQELKQALINQGLQA